MRLTSSAPNTASFTISSTGASRHKMAPWSAATARTRRSSTNRTRSLPSKTSTGSSGVGISSTMTLSTADCTAKRRTKYSHYSPNQSAICVYLKQLRREQLFLFPLFGNAVPKRRVYFSAAPALIGVNNLTVLRSENGFNVSILLVLNTFQKIGMQPGRHHPLGADRLVFLRRRAGEEREEPAIVRRGVSVRAQRYRPVRIQYGSGIKPGPFSVALVPLLPFAGKPMVEFVMDGATQIIGRHTRIESDSRFLFPVDLLFHEPAHGYGLALCPRRNFKSGRRGSGQFIHDSYLKRPFAGDFLYHVQRILRKLLRDECQCVRICFECCHVPAYMFLSIRRTHDDAYAVELFQDALELVRFLVKIGIAKLHAASHCGKCRSAAQQEVPT